MADALRSRYEDLEVELVDSGGGAFEVSLDGRLLHSKLETGRYPTVEEIADTIDRR